MEHTLELFRLVIGKDEAEYEAQGTISEYLIERSAMFANQLGRANKKIKEVSIIKDHLSEDWVLMCYCERV